METITVTFNRRQIALILRILMLGESVKRLAKTTRTTTADLRLIASDQLAPTAGLLRYLDLQREEGVFAWQA